MHTLQALFSWPSCEPYLFSPSMRGRMIYQPYFPVPQLNVHNFLEKCCSATAYTVCIPAIAIFFSSPQLQVATKEMLFCHAISADPQCNFLLQPTTFFRSVTPQLILARPQSTVKVQIEKVVKLCFHWAQKHNVSSGNQLRPSTWCGEILTVRLMRTNLDCF